MRLGLGRAGAVADMVQVGPREVTGTGWWYEGYVSPMDPGSLAGVRSWFGPTLPTPSALQVPPPSYARPRSTQRGVGGSSALTLYGPAYSREPWKGVPDRPPKPLTLLREEARGRYQGIKGQELDLGRGQDLRMRRKIFPSSWRSMSHRHPVSLNFLWKRQ